MTQLGEIHGDKDALLTNDTYDAGDILYWPSDVLPSGWAWCDGAAKTRAGATAALYAAIGTDHGAGDGSTTFNVPDMRQRHGVGATTDAGGGSGGAIDHTHPAGTLAQKNHTHPPGALVMPNHGHGHGLSTGHGHGMYLDYYNIGGADITLTAQTFAYGVNEGGMVGGGLGGSVNGSGDIGAAGATGSAGSAALTGATAAQNAPYLVVNHIIKL